MGNNLTYLWDFGDGNTSIQQYPTHTYLTSGPFDLCLTVDDRGGCVDAFCDSINSNGILFKVGFNINIIAPPIATSIEDKSEKISDVIVYPSPATNQLTIINNQFSINQINIIDVTGKSVKRKVTRLNRIDVSGLIAGIYFIEIIGEENKVIRKFVKE